MAEVEVSYKSSLVTSMSASGTKTLATMATWLEDDIVITYTRPAAPTPALQSKTVSPSTSSITVAPDSGYDGLSSVTVNAMPSGSATVPDTEIYTTLGISVDVRGFVSTHSIIVQDIAPSIVAGYISAGTAGSIIIDIAGATTLDTLASQTFTPTTSNQTIPVGKYTTGVQTILGDANLIASNIKDGVSIFGVTGTYGGGTTGTVYQDGDGYIVLDPDGEQLTITQDSTTKILTIE